MITIPFTQNILSHYVTSGRIQPYLVKEKFRKMGIDRTQDSTLKQREEILRALFAGEFDKPKTKLDKVQDIVDGYKYNQGSISALRAMKAIRQVLSQDSSGEL